MGGIVWWRVIPRLVETNRVVIPDLPGLGESEPFQRQFDAVAVAEWLRELIRKTTDEPTTLVAHSLLGVYAARFSP